MQSRGYLAPKGSNPQQLPQTDRPRAAPVAPAACAWFASREPALQLLRFRMCRCCCLLLILERMLTAPSSGLRFLQAKSQASRRSCLTSASAGPERRAQIPHPLLVGLFRSKLSELFGRKRRWILYIALNSPSSPFPINLHLTPAPSSFLPHHSRRLWQKVTSWVPLSYTTLSSRCCPAA